MAGDGNIVFAGSKVTGIFATFDIRKNIFQFTLPFIQHPSCVVQNHFTVHDGGKHIFPVLHSNGQKIRPSPGVILFMHADRLTVWSERSPFRKGIPRIPFPPSSDLFFGFLSSIFMSKPCPYEKNMSINKQFMDTLSKSLTCRFHRHDLNTCRYIIFLSSRFVPMSPASTRYFERIS